MSSTGAVVCAHCGAPGSAIAGAPIFQCRFCGRETSLQLPLAERRGALIAAGDCRGPTVGGWLFDRRQPPPDGEWLECRPGPVPELRVTLPAKKATTILWLSGAFDDVDLAMWVRFATTVSADALIGFRFRMGPKNEGGYGARLWSDGAWGLDWVEGNEHKGYLAAGRRPPQGWGPPPAPNFFRVVASGSRLRMYIGGVLVSSLHDTRYTQGLVNIRVAAGDAPLDLMIANLDLREAS